MKRMGLGESLYAVLVPILVAITHFPKFDGLKQYNLLCDSSGGQTSKMSWQGSFSSAGSPLTFSSF